jgi:hypothetical protein
LGESSGENVPNYESGSVAGIFDCDESAQTPKTSENEEDETVGKVSVKRPRPLPQQSIWDCKVVDISYHAMLVNVVSSIFETLKLILTTLLLIKLALKQTTVPENSLICTRMN